jgi:hypothetical protein
MKKTNYLLLILALVLSASCKRDWVCVCTFDDGSSPNELVIGSSNKDAAESTCDEYSEDVVNIGANCFLAE